MKDQTIIRTPKNSDRPFFSTARVTAQDSKLSFEARGVLWYLLSKPDDWIVQVSDVMREGGLGRDKAKRLLKELRDAGYIETETVHNKEGRFAGKIDRIYEVSRSTENPANGESGTREINPLHITESIQITEKEIAAPAATARKPKTERPANPYFDAIAKSFGYTDERKPTRSESGRIGKAANELREAGYTPEQIPLIYGYCVKMMQAQNWKGFTPLALIAHANNWKRTIVTPTNHIEQKRYQADWTPDLDALYADQYWTDDNQYLGAKKDGYLKYQAYRQQQQGGMIPPKASTGAAPYTGIML